MKSIILLLLGVWIGMEGAKLIINLADKHNKWQTMIVEIDRGQVKDTLYFEYRNVHHTNNYKWVPNVDTTQLLAFNRAAK